MTLKSEIEQEIQRIVLKLFNKDINLSESNIEDSKNGKESGIISVPKFTNRGDYQTATALTLEEPGSTKAKEIATTIVSGLKKSPLSNNFSDIQVGGAGFINFTLSPEYFAQTVANVLQQKDAWGRSNVYAGKKILVEHSSPNLFKPFHIGHLMNNTIGESIVRLAQASGGDVRTMSFPSDISLGVAKAIFVLLEKGEQTFTIQSLGDAYIEGTKRYDEDESVHSRVKEIADNLYAHNASPELELFDKAKKFNIEYFEKITAQLGSHFDSYIYESEAGVDGKKIVEANTPRVFTESEGAIVYVPDEKRKDINTAVFINSQGNPTYEAKDIGLIDMKFKKFAPDTSLFVTDNNQSPHFDVVLTAAEEINDQWKERVKKSLHIPHGRMTFRGQKMSSRLGGVPLVEDVLETVVEEVKAKNPDIAAGDAEAIGIAALKFTILRAQAGKNIDFDPDTSLSFEGDSGPYLQYSVVRAQSVLAKAEITSSTTLPSDWQTTDLERILVHFPEIVERAISEWAPHHVVSFLLELAQAFNSWYAGTKIIDESDASGYKLALTDAFAQTMQNGLYLLAIEVPQKM